MGANGNADFQSQQDASETAKLFVGSAQGAGENSKCKKKPTHFNMEYFGTDL